MNCRQLAAQVDAYLDGDLDEVGASACRGHLRTCAACRDLADQQTPRLKAMESALDKVRAKFGDAAIGKGLSLRDTRRRTTSSTRSSEADPDA